MGTKVFVVSIEYGGPGYKNPGDAEEYEVWAVCATRAIADQQAEAARVYAAGNGEELWNGENGEDWSADVHVAEHGLLTEALDDEQERADEALGERNAIVPPGADDEENCPACQEEREALEAADDRTEPRS